MTQTAFLDSPHGAVSIQAGTVAGERFLVLDSWRGICALLVALFHFPTASTISQSAFVGSSYLFVDFFFVLSGFVIASSYGWRLSQPREVARFAVVRFGRIYPLHFLMLAAFAGFELLRLMLPQVHGAGAAPFTGGFSLQSLLANLLLLQGVGFEDQLTWNAPSWSISAEFFAYLLFAGVVFTAGARAWVWFVAAAIAAPLFLLGFSTHHMDVSFDFGFIRCLYGFSLGALLAWFQHDSIAGARQALARTGPLLSWTLAEIVMAAVIVLFIALAGDNDAGIAAPLVFALALFLFAHEGGWISVFLRTPFMLTLGALSYSIYMVHIFVQARMINVAGLVERKLGLGLVGDIVLRGEPATGFGAGWAGDVAILVMLLVTIGVSWITWRCVEMPAMAWFRRLSKRI
ncbi:acyltransferase [Mesorhizobium sp. B2-2-4]|uniref:acyltransferase family protein n=1 Tax=unclassified Mesorhizobium TaxID=325217 RepID=UPI00112B38CF|nr:MULTISPECIES: acyltransferase [unclassified Mesorhizobium]MBZ9960069.1 acyltransferase [Mesorhizobium sp. BR1-1-14]TPM54265.1 acyltransferase [Mesorhizobium sp. B2-2-4]TPM64513.1 acyltransferase [Mesorhizobium sp. B2-2-1]TPN69553.1 acyltransferase [Mesorhizobium sp. B1-1-3]